MRKNLVMKARTLKAKQKISSGARMNAIIMAAGFGSRMAPVTLDTPKPLVKVNGVRFIETLIDSFLSKGIEDIVIVRGYKKEQFDVLLNKYPMIKFVDNDEYDKGNNILSIEKVLPYLNDTFIAEADLSLSNPDLIDTTVMNSYYLARYVNSTDDWCFDKKDGYLTNYRKGGSNCYLACGLSYWTKEDCEKIKKGIVSALKSEEGRNAFWEFVPFLYNQNDFRVIGKDYSPSDIVEIDSYDELCLIDPSYRNYKRG